MCTGDDKREEAKRLLATTGTDSVAVGYGSAGKNNEPAIIVKETDELLRPLFGALGCVPYVRPTNPNQGHFVAW
jgi:hypothetical protein